MPTNVEISTNLKAWCPACGNLYVGASLFFLYADERGFYCSDCGSVVIAGDDGHQEKASNPRCLVITESLEGSELHRELVALTGEKEGMRVLVDRTGETRTVRLKTSISPENTDFAVGNGRR